LKASTSKQHTHDSQQPQTQPKGGPITPKGTANAGEPQPEGDLSTKGTANGEEPQPKGGPTTSKGTANGGEPRPDGDLPAKGCQLEPGLVRRLFDKELDNQHEEALLLAQLVAHQLRLALQRDTDHDFVQRVVVWANAAEQVSKQVEALWSLKLPTMRSSPLKAPAAKALRLLVSGSIKFDLQSRSCSLSTL